MDRLTLTAGLAYATVKKDVSIDQTDTDVFSSLNFVNHRFWQRLPGADGRAAAHAREPGRVPLCKRVRPISSA